jgi:hypothetical protein
MGHSAGGAFMQVVLNHGYGCAGVGLNSAPTEGLRVTPWTQLHSVFPVLKNPLNHHKAVQPSNAKHYKGKGTITEHDTYDGRPHLMVAGEGWEEIADRALEWALANSSWTLGLLRW